MPGPDVQEITEEVKVTPERSSIGVSYAILKDPTELLNGRQIRTKLDAMVPSLTHVVKGIQARGAMKSQEKEQKLVLRFPHQYKVGTPCYALYHGPQRDKDSKWVPAIVTEVNGSRNVYVRVFQRGSIWLRHIEQLRPRSRARFRVNDAPRGSRVG